MNFLIGILIAVAFIVVAPILGGFLNGFDRVLSARMQGRKGPSVLQPFYDVRKLFNKELLIVNKLQGVMILSHLLFVIITGVLFFLGCNLLLVIFLSATAGMFLVLAGGCTDSPYSSLGTQRELLQCMCAEPMELLVAVGFYLACGSFMTSDIVKCEIPAIVSLPGIFIGLLVIITVKMRKSPFDLSTSHHAHQELVKGLTTEMTGNYLAVMEISEWYENVFLLALVALFFITSNPITVIWGVLAALVVWFLEILIDNTSARVSWQSTFKVCWIVTLIFGGLNLLILSLIW